jgi:hypothetical protein
MAVALVAHTILAVSPVIREQAQDRIGTARDLAIVPAGAEFDALAGREAVRMLHDSSSRDGCGPLWDQGGRAARAPRCPQSADQIENDLTDLILSQARGLRQV